MMKRSEIRTIQMGPLDATRLVHLLRLALVVSLIGRAACAVTIRNWTAKTTVVVTPNPNGTTEELVPNQWIVYTLTITGKSGLFTMANRMDDNVVTIPLNDGQILALVDNVDDFVDGILIDSQGRKIKTLFINL